MSSASEHRLVPPALLLGVVGSFVTCCLAGRALSRRNPFVHFERFHTAINPEGLFYPTASQVRALGRDFLDRDRIAVLVGGSSILHGAGQRAEEVWTRHLQAALGDDYRVINFALPGSMPAEFGATAAEMLVSSFPRLIFVTDSFLRHATAPRLSRRGLAASVPFHAYYGYFFWDALFKGLLPVDPDRETALRRWIRACSADANFAEQVQGLRVDSLTYSRDLWTTLAYTHFSTVWFRQGMPGSFTRPRSQSPAPADGQQPDAVRRQHCTPACLAERLPLLRDEVAQGRLLVGGSAAVGLEQAPALVLPPSLRGRTLLLPVRYSPYYVSGLSRREQADYRAAFPVFVAALKRAGFASQEVEGDYSNADFVDICHLSESGGRKLAAEVAPAIRRLAHRLGYEGERGVSTPRCLGERGRDDRVNRE